MSYPQQAHCFSDRFTSGIINDREKSLPANQHLANNTAGVNGLQSHFEFAVSLWIAGLADPPTILPMNPREPIFELNHLPLGSSRISHDLRATLGNETCPLIQIKFPSSEIDSLHGKFQPFRIGISIPSRLTFSGTVHKQRSRHSAGYRLFENSNNFSNYPWV